MADPKTGGGLKTVDKAIRILDAFSHTRPELSIGELSKELDIHKSIVSRLVSSLCQGRLLEQDPITRKVRVGVGAFRLGSVFANREHVVRRLLPFLGTLTARTDQSTHAMILDGALGLVAATVDSPNALRVITRVGEHRHLHATSAGKILLAFSPPPLLKAVAASPGLLGLTPQTITEVEVLERQLEEIQSSRLAWNIGESQPGVGGIAAPVLDDGGNIVAAIATVFPMNVAGETEQQAFAKETLVISERISELFRSDGGLRSTA